MTGRFLSALVLGAVLAILPRVAFAGTPAMTPSIVQTEGFETALAPDWVVEPVDGIFPPSSAWWGPVTQRAASGTHGLWCAGSAGWNAWGYPDGTAGLATLSLPQLADYYSATLTYKYTMPSLGSDDGNALNVLWDATPHARWDYHYGRPLTAVNGWRTDTWDMTSPGNVVNTSRQPARVRFQFVDSSGNAYESPTAGEGATIDDVSVTGYKYGPVRSAQVSAASADSVRLNWRRPASSTASAVDDTRSITYRVWRSPDVQPYTWTEVSGAGVSDTTFIDSSPRGGQWRYIVQAWDPAGGPGYGQVETSAGVSVFVDKAPESTILFNPASPGPDGAYVVPPTVTVSREFEGTTYWRWGSGAFTATTQDSFQVPAPVTTDATRTLEVYSTNTLGTPETPHKTATYTLKTYRVLYAAADGGSISGAVDQFVFYGGSSTSVTAVPAAGHHFVGWSDGTATATRTDTGITTDLLVSADFAIDSYTLSYAAGAHGAVSGTSPQTVQYGGTGTAVTAVPATGYHFAGWSDGARTAARVDGPVSANVAVSANFAIDTYPLHYTAGAGGTLSGTASQTVNYGGGGTVVTAVADAGHHFVSWSDGYLLASRADIAVTHAVDVTADFAVDAVDTFTLFYSASAGGTIIGTSPQTVARNAGGTEVTASPNTGYHFVRWSDGRASAARTDTGVNADKSITAVFAINTYPLHYTAGAGGTISGAASQTVPWGGSGSAVTAVPKAGYHFTGWSDRVATAGRTDAGMLAALDVTASFALDAYQLHYSAAAGGTIDGTTSQTVSYGSRGATVTAVPAFGYHFVGWDDDPALGASRADAGTGPVTAQAHFALGVADTTPPVTAWTGAAATFIAKATIALSASDGLGSGVTAIWYKLDTGADTRYSAPLSVTRVGAHVLYFWSLDKLGNVEARKRAAFSVLIGTTVSITSNHTSVVRRHPVVFSGGISTTQPTNTHVLVYAKKPGSTVWVPLSTRHTTSTHRWSYSYAPATKGTWYFQVRFAGTSKYAASHSSDRRITVK